MSIDKLSLDGLDFQATKINIQNNILTVIINEAEKAETINLSEAETQLAEAEAALAKSESRKDQVEKTFLVKRARARLTAAQKA